MAKTLVHRLRLAFFLGLGLFLLPVGAFGASEAEVKGMFVFGSSLVDNGNNNFLRNTTARADYSPYGIDFPLGPSGRFSNGRNAVDVLGELLRLPAYLPPFADPRTRGPKILHGVNFASGGSGILDQTGTLAGEVVSLTRQIESFKKKTLPDLISQVGGGRHGSSSNCFLSKYLFVVGTGGNDYLLNYFVPGPDKKPSLLQFTDLLVSRLTRQLEELYTVGARKFVVFSIQPLGCIPAARVHLPAGGCIESLNAAALLFNSRLRSLAGTLGLLLPGANVVFVNSYRIVRDIVDDPLGHGFSDGSRACCELPLEGGEAVLCKRGGRVCGDRTAHVFFDGLHPTDAVNFRIAQKAYNSCLLEEAFPSNVKQLVQI